MGSFGSIVSGLGKARLGYSEGQQKRAEQEQQVQQMMFKLALEKAAREQTQSNSDRSFQLQQNTNKRAAEKAIYDQSQPKAPPALQLGTPEYLEAQTAIEKMRTDANIRQAETIGRLPARPTYRDLHPEANADAGAVSTGDVRRDRAADDFATRQIEAFQGNAPKAVAYVESNPVLKAQAKRLGITQSHYNAATSRRGNSKASASRFAKPSATADGKDRITTSEYKTLIGLGRTDAEIRAIYDIEGQ